MDSKSSYILRFLSISLLALIYSCGTTKTIVKGPPPIRTEESIVKALAANEVDFQWYNAKIGANIKSPEYSGGATIILRMEAESIIWAQFKKLAVEGGRALVTKDSFFVINRIERSYQRASLQAFFDMIENKIGFLDLQKIFLGNVFPSKLLSITSFDQIDGECFINADVNDSALKLKYGIDAYSQLVNSLEFEDEEGNSFYLTLDDYRLYKSKQIPYSVVATLNYNGVEYAIDLEIKDLELDVQKEMIFSIPSHYEEIIR